MNIAPLKEEDSYYLNKFIAQRSPAILHSNGKSKAKEVCEYARAVKIFVNESLKKSDESSLGLCDEESDEKKAGDRMIALLDDEPELENDLNLLKAFTNSVCSVMSLHCSIWWNRI